jgi:hypothetical protein
MKNRLLPLVFSMMLVLGFGAKAQTTITTVGTGYTGSNGAGAGYAVTFVVENLSGNDILLTGVGNYWNSGESGNAELWYSSTSLSGTYGTLATPTWNLITSNNVTVSATGITPAFSNMTFLIPNGAQYRFALYSAAYCRYSGTGVGTCTPNTFTTGGVSLKVGDVQINSAYIGYASTNNPRFFTGYITFANACALPQNVAASNITVNSANLSWTKPSGSAGSEYVFNQTAASPTGSGTFTTGTTYSASGLNLNSTYYFHVRNKCSATSFSSWVNYSFTTANAYCLAPTNILFSNITTSSVNLLWSLMPTSDHYQYIVDQTTSAPAYNTAINTTAISASVTGLLPDTKYYVHLRSICLGGADSSIWKLDSFVTKNYCGAPEVLVPNLGSNNPIAIWGKIASAISYEYRVTATSTPPSFGDEVKDTTVTVTLPNDSKEQYLHVRTKCNSQFLFSNWTTTQLRTTSIYNVSGNENTIQVYPNPVKDVLFVSVKGAEEGVYNLTDITGKTMLQGVLHANEQINTAGLPNGTYLLKCTINSAAEVLKVIKQ